VSNRVAVERNSLKEKEGAVVETNGGLVQVEMTLTGDSPLLMNAMSQEQLLNIRGKVKASKNAAKPELREEADSKVHRLPDGNPCIPVKALYGSFVNAGCFVRLDGKRQISTQKATVLPGMLILLDTQLPLYIPGTENVSSWEVDIQQGRNPNGGEAVCIVRPRFDQWEIRCTVELDQGEMPSRMCRELVTIAGRRIGLLEYRPQRKGVYGRFSITRFVLKNPVE
jgi:hypothetical protein